MPSAILGNNVELVYDRFGPAGGEPVVLIPGAGAPAEFWPGRFCNELAGNSYCVVRYSHRDTGFSTHFDTPYGIHELLGDLEAFLGEFDHDAAHLVGHSMGGYLAQLAMCEFPEKLRTATSISAGSAVSDALHAELGTSRPGPETWEKLMQNEPSGNFDADLPGWLESWIFLNGNRPFDEALAIEYTRVLYQGDPRNAEVAVNHVHAMGTVPDSLVRDLRGTSTPLLVLHGTDDPLVPIDNGEATARLAGAGTFCPLDGAGHMFFDNETWDEIAGRVVRHLNGQSLL